MFNENTIDVFVNKINTIDGIKEKKWALYGTGNGAELVYKVFDKANLLSNLILVIERDEEIIPEKEFHGISIVKLSEACDFIEGITIGAFDNSNVIEERISQYFLEKNIDNICVLDILHYNTVEEKAEYIQYLEKKILKKSDDFVDCSEVSFVRRKGDSKVIAWYLPQFHKMEINDVFHGKGFTEWTNTTTMMPLFTGHYQPHVPYDVGYYDLLNVDTFKRQIKLAKHYGVYGFCIHYYWFSGKRIMEKPLELLLNHKELDIPFCFNWATENWTALWDGGNKEIMVEQTLEDGDEEKFMNDILPYMNDPRYIKINGRPVLVIYSVNNFEKNRIKHAIEYFREKAKNEGFPDLYIMVTNAFKFEDDATEWGLDAMVEFPPHEVQGFMKKYRPEGYINPYYKGGVLDATEFIENKQYMINHKSKKCFRSALVSWDNSARKARTGANIVTGLSPSTFKTWLKDIMCESNKVHSEEENIVFVNSWNEWAEGSHLEPDMKYGYAYLQAVKEALEENREDGR